MVGTGLVILYHLCNLSPDMVITSPPSVCCVGLLQELTDEFSILHRHFIKPVVQNLPPKKVMQTLTENVLDNLFVIISHFVVSRSLHFLYMTFTVCMKKNKLI